MSAAVSLKRANIIPHRLVNKRKTTAYRYCRIKEFPLDVYLYVEYGKDNCGHTLICQCGDEKIARLIVRALNRYDQK